MSSILDWIIEWMVVFFIEGGDIGVVGFKENIFNLVLDVWSGFFKQKCYLGKWIYWFEVLEERFGLQLQIWELLVYKYGN